MVDDPALAAMHRIESALARIEAQVAVLPPAGSIVGAYAMLEERHTRLREGVRDVMSGLDRAIEAKMAS